MGQTVQCGNKPGKNTLTIRENSILFIDPMSSLYPVGMRLDVFYNPEKPKQSYVEIRNEKPSVVGKIMLFTGIGCAAVGLAAFLLLTYL